MPRPLRSSMPMLVFQRLLEEFERRQIARAQAQAFQIEHLHERHQPEQRDGDQRCAMTTAKIMTAPARSGRGQAELARASAFRRAPCARHRSRDLARAGGARRAASGCGLRASVEWPNSRAWRGRGASEIATEPSGAGLLACARSAGKRKHIGGVILAAKSRFRRAQFGIAGDQAVEGAAIGDLAPAACGRSAGWARGRNVGGGTAESDATAFGRGHGALRPAAACGGGSRPPLRSADRAQLRKRELPAGADRSRCTARRL